MYSKDNYKKNSFQNNNGNYSNYSHYKGNQEKNYGKTTRKLVPEFPLISTVKESNILRITTYNILSDSLTSVSLGIEDNDIQNYPYLKWSYRSNKILKEIQELKSDIVAVQEFEKDQKFIDELQNIGYDVVFKPRPGDHSEGCALLISASKFNILEVYSMIFNMNESNKDISPIYDRDNCAAIATLSVNNTNTILIVASVHLLFNKSRGDIKLAQIYQLINAITKLKESLKAEYPDKTISSTICGDMNSLPCSGLYKFVRSGEIDLTNATPETLSQLKLALSLNRYEQNEIKNQLFRKTNFFDESKKIMGSHSFSFIPTEEWINNILRVEVTFNKEESSLSLNYKSNYKYTSDLKIKAPMKFESAYASMMRYVSNYFITKEISHPFNLMEISKPEDLINMEIFGFRAGKDSSSSINFIKNLTLEPPFTTMNKNQMYTTDYIFYEESNDFKPLRIMNTPDIINFINENEFVPSEVYASDHLSLTVDFLLS